MNKSLLAALAMISLAFAGCVSETQDDGTDKEPEMPAPMPGEIQFGNEDAPIRPGASLGGYCTFNFIFQDNTTGDVFIGTAAHCTDGLGEALVLPGVGEIAEVVFDSDLIDEFPDVDVDVDFSLARIFPEFVNQTNPMVLGYEGPVGNISMEEMAVGDVVAIHGYGMIFGDVEQTRDRFGALVDWDDRLYLIDMPAVPGDSGSPILHSETGKAFGIISRFGTGAIPPSTDEGPHMPFIFRQLAANGFENVELSVVS